MQRKRYCTIACGACHCGGVKCFLAHAVSCSLFWPCLDNLNCSIAYHLIHFPSMPHNYSSVSLLHTTSRSTSTPPRRSNVPLYDYTKAICTSLNMCRIQNTPPHNDIFVLYIYSSVSICLPQSESLACPWTTSNFSHTHPYLSAFIHKSSRVNGLIAAVVSVSQIQLHSQIKFKRCLFSSPRNKYIFI